MIFRKILKHGDSRVKFESVRRHASTFHGDADIIEAEQEHFPREARPMSIVIVGAGGVGSLLAKKLSEGDLSVTLIDSHAGRVARARQSLRVAVVQGSGTSVRILREAGIEKATVLVAVTDSDEVNLIACMMARQFGVEKRIARVRNTDYSEPDSGIGLDLFGVSYMVHPERETAGLISRLIRQSNATDVLDLFGGAMRLIGLRIDKNYPFDLQLPLRELAGKLFHEDFRAVAIRRGDGSIVPRGNDAFLSGDQVFVTCRSESAENLVRSFGLAELSIRNIMVLGGGLIGRELVRHLAAGSTVKLIGSANERPDSAAGEGRTVPIVRADDTDMDRMAREGIAYMDVFVAATADDETNIITTLLAKHLKVPRTIALVNKAHYIPLTPTIGLDAVVNKQVVTVESIVKMIRSGPAAASPPFPGIEVEAMELEVARCTRITCAPLRDVKFPEGAIVGAGIRGTQAFVPTGDSVLAAGDRVIVFALPRVMKELDSLFR
jgi:trk system potassium uptake protein TrkA